MITWYLKSNKIFDSTTATTFAGIIQITDERITAIYHDSEVSLPANAHLIDYGEQLVLPGFIDAHQHIYLSALVYAQILHYVSGVTPATVAQKVAQVPKYQGWKLALGFYASDFPNQQTPTSADLDRLDAITPTMVIAGDAHSVWLNTAAMATLNLPQLVASNYGGRAVQDDQGYTGFFEEGIAIAIIAQILTQICPPTTRLYLAYAHHLNTMGITGVADLALSGSAPDDLIYPTVYQQLTKTSTVRTSIYPAMRPDITRVTQISQLFAHEDRIQFGGVKQFYDGVTSTQTAYLKAPYPDSTKHGGPLLPDKLLHELILTANQHGWPIRVHTIGDEAVWQTLTAFAQANQKFPLPNDYVNSLEHLELIDRLDLGLIGATKAILSVQPSHALIGYDTLDLEVGPERVKNIFLFKDFIEAGATLAFGTDSPIVIDNTPLETLFYATTRRTLANKPQDAFRPDQALSVATAILAHTKNAAQAIGRHDIGMIALGNLADLVVLDTDILGIPAPDLLNVKVQTTIFNGQRVFTNNK
ncbi:amidohydrolase [Periweissella ghanensis]|uniref:N-substituted formamide deformylase n=1 Tax=Periweissella ghanensis TaxID=467997 RepID=A0ABN8BNG4_9LACO|nr:amidohydrolase family protein [Periweissella ghanensis]MCM0600874.1 amidohydrolase family protein [Periweissella ghanensis]CAH0417709.1 N-substituted formamide deformylase [Periweissella ghanensis]